jgi:sugar phosphate isomerase/epimerase
MNKLNHSRRNFIKLIGISTTAVSLSGFKIFTSASYKASIGLQLYTIRKNIAIDFEGSIRKAAEIGYEGIETYALPENITLKHAAKVFKDNGLKIFSMHSELPVRDQRDMALKMADAYNSDRIVYHGWPQGEKYKNEDALKNTADIYNETASFLKTKGLKFGLHNHWWDFEKNEDGIYPFYYLLDNLDKNIFFEIDTYWAKTAGQDPAKILKDFGSRAPLLHIKDGPAVEGERSYEQVAAGKGVMDFPAIVKAGGENIEWMIVEFDEYKKDIFSGIKDSYNYLTKNGLAAGKV